MRRLVVLVAVALAAIGAPVAALALSGPTEMPDGTKAALRLELDDEDPRARITGSGFSCTLAISEQTAEFSAEEDRETGCQQFYESATGSPIRLTAVPSSGFFVSGWRGSMPACKVEAAEGASAPRSITIPRAQLKLAAGGDTPLCQADFERRAAPPDPCANARPLAPLADGDLCTEVPACPPGAIMGTDAPIEVLEGTAGDDAICALGGNDVIYGKGGNDLILAGPGLDAIVAGAGDDRVYAGQSGAIVLGGPDDDLLVAGPSSMVAYGGGGIDVIVAGQPAGFGGSFGCGGDDRLLADSLSASPGTVGHTLSGDSPDATAAQIVAALAAIEPSLPFELPAFEVDCAPTDTGDDEIVGSNADDVLSGGPGKDTIDGRGGADAISGGPGSDPSLRGGDGRDEIDGGPNDDTIEGGPDDDNELTGLVGGPGRDRIDGGPGDDRIDGGSGNDPSLRGGDGRDTVLGGVGRDRLLGGGRRDVLLGGPDDDVFDARDGVRDKANGGPGTDTGEFDAADERLSIEGAAVLP